jgi:hypothetical protein
VPNRIVHLFLQEAGERYDLARGLPPYRKMTAPLLARFDGGCAYCFGPYEAEDHVAPRNRQSAGLHAWGNVVPTCKSCNNAKRYCSWQELVNTLPLSDEQRALVHERIAQLAQDYAYDPDVDALLPILDQLYRLADQQTRGLVQFAVVASETHMGNLRRAEVVAALEVAAADVDAQRGPAGEVSEEDTGDAEAV